jgi:hypothetical protein
MNLAVDPIFFDLLAGSYSRLVGDSLVPPEHDNHAVRWLYEGFRRRIPRTANCQIRKTILDRERDRLAAHRS